MKREWTKNQTAARFRYGSEAEGSVLEERLVEQYVDPQKKDGPTFYLYYFAKDFDYLAEEDRKRTTDVKDRTVLFMSGGPGEVNRPGNDNFGDLGGFRVVYFHLRGAGFSQMPASNYYDRFLRTAYAVEDIEKIRDDLGVERWCAVIGHSYGSVLAQQYACKFGPKRVAKLVLSAPLSRHRRTVETIQFDSLEKIYESNSFDFLKGLARRGQVEKLRRLVADKAKEVSDKAEAEFGSVQLLLEEYSEKKNNGKFRESLKERGLNYSREFFKALRKLRMIGWLPHEEDLAKGVNENIDTVQQLSGLLIAKEILDHQANSYDMTELNSRLDQFFRTNPSDEVSVTVAKQIREARDYFGGAAPTAPRVFYLISIYDGISERFLQEFETRHDVKAAIESLGGRRRHKNQPLDYIAIENDAIKRWDPKCFRHDVATLILKGSADPVTEGGQAEHFFKEALTGERTLIEFPGIGHSMALPAMDDTVKTRDYLLQEFIVGDFERLRTVVLPKVRRAFDDLLSRESHKRYGKLKVKVKYALGKAASIDW